MMTSPTISSDVDRMRLTVPNHGDFVALARFAAGVAAVRAGFDIEEVQDLQLAVDEMYASSGVLRGQGDATIEINRSNSEVSISLTFDPTSESSEGKRRVSQDKELALQLLSALVDEHGSSADDQGSPCVWLRKSHTS
jgi:hypothetical protein